MDDSTVHSVAENIVRSCRSKDKIQELLSRLSSFDWEPLIKEIDDDVHERRCWMCHEWKDSRKFSSVIHKNVTRATAHRVCPECFSTVSLEVKCIRCERTYPSLESLPDFLCFDCDAIYELVSNNNTRARKIKLPATLTARQWTEIMRYFDEKCAYCGGKYECLEHYIPLSLMIEGTTASNCFPSCFSCNLKKGNLHPDEFANLFPRENIERIRSWLEQAVNN